MKICDTKKASDNPTTNVKWYEAWLKSVTQHSYFEKKPNK
jgi:hypothetical protein